MTKEASRDRLEVEREKRARCSNPRWAKRGSTCEPIIGPEPMIKIVLGGVMPFKIGGRVTVPKVV